MTNRLALSKDLICTFAAAATVALASGASAAPVIVLPSLTLTLKEHRFTPATLTVPAGARVRITLINRDLATEEFDSHDLRLEQLVTPMGKVSFEIGPLRAGQYRFMGEFHSSTAQGKVIAVAAGR
ncbi:MAG: hypothetical protein NVS3B5_19480 [Sphingomicrobium sp.]